MQIDLYLPCICFQVSIWPGDPSHPSDLEYAALRFIEETENDFEDNFRKLEAFLGLGRAVFQDMLIRMVNRHWVCLAESDGRRIVLKLSEAAHEALNGANPPMSSAEEGKNFTLCYDLLGGGFASIPPRFLSRSMADSAALQPVRGGKNESEFARRPYRKLLNGYLSGDGSFADPHHARILQALQTDRVARSYLGSQDGSPSTLHVSPPGKVLSQNDIMFYRCRFDVYSSGAVTDDGWQIPVLECIEQRNATVRRLGQLNAQAIVEDAIESSDTRLRSLLRDYMAYGTGPQRAHSDPIDILLRLVEGRDEDLMFGDIEDSWDVVRDRIGSLVDSRIETARRVDRESIRSRVAEMAADTGARLLVSSPQVRIDSPELTADPASILSALVAAEAVPLVHAVKGRTARGSELSDPQALARLHTLLAGDHMLDLDQSLEHVRTPFIVSDGGQFVLLSGAPFGERELRAGLAFDFHRRGSRRSFAQLTRALPGDVREWIERNDSAMSGQQVADWEGRAPETLANALRDIEEQLNAITGEDWADADLRKALLRDLAEQFVCIRDWIRLESNSAEFISGAAIQEYAAAFLNQSHDDQPLILGVSGSRDAGGFSDMIDLICNRLSRQDIAGIINAPLLVLLPSGPEFTDARSLFEQRVGADGAGHRLLIQPVDSRQDRPTSFILAPASALISQDGIVRFIPTIGRRVKAIHLGIHVLGKQAQRQLADFLADEWPAAADMMRSIACGETLTQPGLSQIQRNRLVATAQAGWFDDGNMGANAAARHYIVDGQPGKWRECYDRACKLLDAREADSQRAAENAKVGYALLKAVANLGERDRGLSTAALERIAHAAAKRHDLLVASILADHLPASAILRDPHVRTLAFFLSRQMDPDLSADDRNAVATAGSGLLCLASALMLDGLNGGLVEILAEMDDGILGVEARLTRAIALYVRAHGSQPIDRPPADEEVDKKSIDDTVEAIVSRLDAASRRRTQGLPRQVEALQDLVFATAGSFAADLLRFFETKWPTLPPEKRSAALAKILAAAESDLGVDIFSQVSQNRTIKARDLSERYIDKKNKQMQQLTEFAAVNLTMAGGHMIRAIRFVVETMAETVVPQVIAASDTTASRLSFAVSEFLAAGPQAGDPGDFLFRKLLADRLGGIGAQAGYRSPAWRFPSLSSGTRPDWRALAASMMTHEFGRDSDLADIIKWFLDRSIGASDTARADAPLTLIADVIEASKGGIDDGTLARMKNRITEHFESTARTMAEHGRAASSFERSFHGEEGGLCQLAGELADLIETMQADLAQGELAGAILCADDLRSQYRSLLERWESESRNAPASFYAGNDHAITEELKRILLPHAAEADLADAKSYCALRADLTVPIRLEEDIQYDIGDGRVPDRLDDTRPLMEIVAKYRRPNVPIGHDGAAMANAVIRFLSITDQLSLVPTASLDGAIWRVVSDHPAFNVLSFANCGKTEVIVAGSREAEIALRATWERDAKNARILGGHASAKSNQILLSLHINQEAPLVGVLPWRQLAQLCMASPRHRRIGVLSWLARQKFTREADISTWWKSYSLKERRELLQALLELPEGWWEEDQPIDTLISLSRDVCLSLGLFADRDRQKISLSEKGARRISKAWSELGVSQAAANPAVFESAMSWLIEKGA